MNNKDYRFSSSRELWVDICKGMAIILVVVGHVITNGMSSGVLSSVGLKWIVDFIYSFHMPLFFFISGYLLKFDRNADYKSICSKFIKKEISLLVPYVVFSALYFMAKFLFGNTGAVVNKVHLSDLWNMFVTPIGEFWYLYALMLFQMIFFVVTLVAKKWNGYEFVLGVVVFISLFVRFCSLKVLPEGIARALPHMFFFFLGAIYRRLVEKNKVLLMNDCNWKVFLIGGSTAVILYFVQYKNDWQNKLIETIIDLAIALVMVWVFQMLCKWVHSRLLEIIGMNSLPIYLLHVFFIVLCRIIFTKVGLAYYEWIYCILSSGVSLLIPLVLYKFVISKYCFMDVFFNTGKYIMKKKRA